MAMSTDLADILTSCPRKLDINIYASKQRIWLRQFHISCTGCNIK